MYNPVAFNLTFFVNASETPAILVAYHVNTFNFVFSLINLYLFLPVRKNNGHFATDRANFASLINRFVSNRIWGNYNSFKYFTTYFIDESEVAVFVVSYNEQY